MKKTVALLLILLATASREAFAAPKNGIGFFGQFGISNASLKTKSDSNPAPKANLLDWCAGGGLVIDTNLSDMNWFNYRIKIGYDYGFAKKSQPFTSMRISFDNIFGYGLIRTQSVRVFVGPVLGIGYAWGKGQERRYYGTENGSPAYNYFSGYTSVSTFPGLAWNPKTGSFIDRVRAAKVWRLSAGAAAGINFNFTDVITLSVDGGAKYTYVTGTWKRRISDGYNTGWPYTYAKPTIRDASESLTGHGFDFFAGVSFMMRAYWIKNI